MILWDSVPEGPSPSAPWSPASELAPPASLDAASAARLLASDANFQPAQSDSCRPTAILVRPKPFLYPQSNSCIESQNHSGWKSPPRSSSPTVNPSNPCVYFFLVGGRVNIVGLAINVIRSSSSLLQKEVSRESQNPSMVGVGRALCGSPSPTLCRSRVTQSRLHSTASRQVWNISREGDSTTSLGSLGQSN